MKKPITILVIVHNDLQDYPREELYEVYFSWLKIELEGISARPVFIYFADHDDVTDLSDFNYRNDSSEEAVTSWRLKVRELYSSMSKQESFHSDLVKILLLTRHNVNEKLWGLLGGVGGVAWQNGYAGIASITSRLTPAHEVGHMLGATHEDSEVQYDGWWHDSIMRADEGSQFRGNGLVFSEKNRQNIRVYMESLP